MATRKALEREAVLSGSGKRTQWEVVGSYSFGESLDLRRKRTYHVP